MTLIKHSDHFKKINEAQALLKETDWPKSTEESWRRVPIGNFPLDEIFTSKLSEKKAWQGSEPDYEAFHHKLQDANRLIQLEKESEPAEKDLGQNGVAQNETLGIFVWHDQVRIVGDVPKGLEVNFFKKGPAGNGHFEEDSKKLPSSLDEYSGKSIDPGHNRFTLLNTAFSPAILIIQAHEAISRVVQVFHLVSRNQDISFPKVMIYGHENSQISVSESFMHEDLFDESIERDSENGAPEFRGTVGVTEIFAGKNSHINYYGIEKLPSNSLGFLHLGGVLERDARLDIGMAQLGARLTKWYGTTFLNEPGAYSHIHGFAFGSKSRHLDLEIRQIHNAPHTTSELNCKRAVTQRSNSTFSGLLLMEKEAKGASALQVNKNIVIGKKARAHSSPKLEIKVDEAQCAHGATISDIDQEAVFYLNNRGIDQKGAQRLIIEGFFDDVIQKAPVGFIKDGLSYLMKTELDRAGI